MKNKKSLLTILLVASLGSSSILASFLLSNRTAFANGAWLSGWNNRRLLTIDGTKIDAALTDFPVLVKLQSSFFDFGKAQVNGQDVRFTDPDGTTLLKYEIEKWNSAGGEAYIWVKIPSVASGSYTTFYMYYGNSSASDAQDPTNVWNNNYVLVLHLEELGSGTRHDSTINHNDGTVYGASGLAKAAPGMIDGADNFTSSSAYINVTHSASLNYGTNATFEFWVNPKVNSGASFSGGLDKGALALYLMANNSQGIRLGKSTKGTILSSRSAVPINSWTYVAGSADVVGTAQRANIYFNGSLDTQTLNGPFVGENNTNHLLIGARGPAYPTEWLNGMLDEIRISNIPRSAAWIRATYHSECNSLLAYGTEEQAGPIYSNVAVTSTKAGSSCEFQVKWSDTVNLDKCLFSTNNTGVWQNESIPVSGMVSWANKTLTLTSTAGDRVGYRWYCNDTLASMGDTGERILTTTGDWWYQKKIFFDNSLISENLVDFPVLVNLTRAGSDFWSHVGTTINDLRFVDSDGATDLYFEVEYWNYTGHEGLVWVKVPQIDASSSSDFVFVFYGNPSPPSSAYINSPQTWNVNFRMVQHLEESSGTQFDSTSNDNDGTAYGSLDRSAIGRIDGADGLDGSSAYLNCGTSQSLNLTQYTLEAWIMRRGSGDRAETGTGGFKAPNDLEPILTKGRAQVDTIGMNVNYFLGVNQTLYIGFDFEDKATGLNHPISSTTPITNDQWYYIVATYSGGNSMIYINGVLDNSYTNVSSPIPDSCPWATAIGTSLADAGTDGFFNGTMDEVRISNAARSAAWIKAQYLSMTDKYISFDAEVFVIPEYLLGALMSLAVCFAAFGVYRMRKHPRLKIQKTRRTM